MKFLTKLFSRSAGAKPASQVASRKKGRNEELQECLASPEIRSKLMPGEEYQLFYGGTNKGYVAAITGEELLLGHQKKITRLISGIGLPREQFQRLIYPVIKNFADYAHNLPASKAHHHFSHGGLLEHSLDVACYAVITAAVTSFDYGSNPSLRTIRRERWYAAATFAALLHDAGKPLNDFEVHDENREHIWPGSIPIFEWAKKHGVRNYFITWIPGRGEKHKVVNPSLVERLIPLETRDWIREGGSDIYYAMLDAIACNDPKSILTGIVVRADSASVEQNLKSGVDRAVEGGEAQVNTPSNFINASQYLLEKGVWSVNQPGARLWVTQAGIFIAWKSAVAEIVNYLDTHKIRGFPRGCDSLGACLLDNGLLEPSSDEGGLYWNVAPDVLANAETGKKLWLKCVKLASIQTLYPFDAPPPPTAVCIGNEADYERYDPEEGLTDGGSQAFVPADAVEQSGVGNVTPMFNLDTGAGDTSPQGAVVPTPLSLNSGPSIPAATGREVHSKQHPAKGPQVKPSQGGAKTGGGAKNKRPSDLGIVLDTSGATTAPAIVITSTASEAQPAASAVSVLQVKPQQQASKKTPKPAKNEGRSVTQKAEVSGPQISPADDVFGNLAGIDIDVDSAPLKQDPLLFNAEDSWVDPFSSPAATVEQATEAVSSGVQSLPAESDNAFSQIEITSEPSRRSTAEPESISIGASAEKKPEPARQEPREDAVIESSAGFDDFDPDLMLLLGMKAATPDLGATASGPEAIAERQGREAKRTQSPAEPGAKVIPQEFRFDIEPQVPTDLPSLPDLNPSQFSSAPAEFRVNDGSAVSSRIAKIPEPELVVVAGDDLLSEFDAPAFASNVIVGEIATIFAAPETNNQKSKEEEESQSRASEAHKPAGQNNRIEQASKKSRPNNSVPGALKIGASTPVAASKVEQPSIKVVPAQGKPSPQMNVGPAMHRRRRGQEPGTSENESNIIAGPDSSSGDAGDQINTAFVKRNEKSYQILPEDHARIFSEAEVNSFEAFLNRYPDFRDKLKWHLESFKWSFNAETKRPFVPFCIDPNEGGFKERDLERLQNSNWLWPNFTRPDDPYINSIAKKRGVFLDGYVVECMEYLSGGRFGFEYMCLPSSAGQNFDRAKLEEYANYMIASSKHHSIVQGGGGRVFKFSSSAMARFSKSLRVKISDLEMALFACTNYFYKQGSWFVLVPDCEVEYE